MMRRFFGAAVLAALAALPATAAERVACREAAQKFEIRRGGWNSIEINNFLFAAAENDCAAFVEFLLVNGASLEARDREGNRVLARAARAGRLAAAQLALKRGAELDHRNIAGSTALYLAAEKDRALLVALLVAAGAAVDSPGRSGVRPLGAAAYNGAEAAVAALLAQGADPEAADSSGKTAAAYAAGNGWPKIVALLIDAGIDVNRPQGHGVSLLAWAAGHAEEAAEPQAVAVIDVLLAHGARIDDADDRGRTPLMAAAEAGHADCAAALLKAGASRAARDKEGKTAAELATRVELRERLR